MSYTYPEALNAMEKIAQDLCVKAFPNTIFSVRVVADSVTGTASVDWNRKPEPHGHCFVTINMPVRKATYRMTHDEFRHWAAYLLHEVGHPFETDKIEWKAAVMAGKHKLLNSLEDVREELCTIKRGIAANATKVFSDLIDMMHAKAVAEGYDPNEINSIGWTLSSLGRRANGYSIDLSDIDAKLDPNGIVGKVVAWALTDLAACKSTNDCRLLSDRIIDFVNAERRKAHDALRLPEPEIEEIDDEPREPQGGQHETRGEQEEDVQPEVPEVPDDVEGQPGVDNSPVVPEDKPEGDVHQGGAPDGAPEKDGDEKSEDISVPEEEDDFEPFKDEDIEEVDLQPTDTDNLVSTGDREAQARVTRMLRNTLKRTGAVDRPISGRIMKDSHAEMVPVKASKMGLQRALLARALKAADNDEYDSGRKHGRINRRALYKLSTGSNTVFGRRTTTEGYDTDVQVLVDGSGSMSGLRIEAASTLALIVAQAAAQVGVDCTAHLFNDDGLHMATKGRAKPVAKKFAYMTCNIMGGTPLSENLLQAAHIQKNRAGNKRRVLFVITDGGCNNGADTLKAAADYVESTGTEIANLHIGSQVMKVFRNEAAVNVMDVSKTGLKQLTTILERGL